MHNLEKSQLILKWHSGNAPHWHTTQKLIFGNYPLFLIAIIGHYDICYTRVTPRLMKSPSIRTSPFAGKRSKEDLALECIPHLSSQADPSRILEISLCFAGREVSLSVLPKLLMEWLCAQLSSLEESACKELVQPNKALGLVVRFSVSNYSAEQKDRCLFLRVRLLSDPVPDSFPAPRTLFTVHLSELG